MKSSIKTKKIETVFDKPIFTVTAQDINAILVDFEPSQSQTYIRELLPYIKDFIASHQNFDLFIVSDLSEYPWDIGEPQWYEWREISAVFSYQGQFLPKNLVQDFGFSSWEDVREYYRNHEPWFLHKQLQESRDILKEAFIKEVANGF